MCEVVNVLRVQLYICAYRERERVSKMAGHMHAVMIHIQIVNNAINTEQVSWESTAGKKRLDQGQKLMRGKRRFPSTFEQSKRPRLKSAFK